MSASLVGSEMCIRDSASASAHARASARARARGTRRALGLGRLLRLWVPVSYTHLTLPTICSV
eukprot:11231553-Alexandrium_andersonii.AAC.1